MGRASRALQRLTIDNPTQQDRLGSLKQHIGAKLGELKQTIDLRQNQGQAAALAVVQSDRGKQDMDAIRDQVSAMEREEIDLRAKRLSEMADAYSRAIFSGIISSLLGIGLTGVIGFLIFRAEAARRKEDWLQGGRVGLIKGDTRRPADRATWRQHSGIPLQISRRARWRHFHKRKPRRIPSGLDLWCSC